MTDAKADQAAAKGPTKGEAAMKSTDKDPTVKN
jgi:hypothetical protein